MTAKITGKIHNRYGFILKEVREYPFHAGKSVRTKYYADLNMPKVMAANILTNSVRGVTYYVVSP